jgi:hypothetical protein
MSTGVSLDGSVAIEGLSEEEKLRAQGEVPQDERAVRRMNKLLGHLGGATPHSTDASIVNRVAAGEPVSRVEPLINELEAAKAELEKPNLQVETFQFPNLPWEALKAGLATENRYNEKLQFHIAEAEKCQGQIKKLLSLSAALSAYKEGTEMNESTLALLAELKEAGIDLKKSDGKVLSKEELTELKSLTSANIEQLRTDLQGVFVTKIQVLTHQISTIIELLKDTIRNGRKVADTALQAMARH